MDLSTPPSPNNSPVILSSPLHGRRSLATETLDVSDITMLPVAAGPADVQSPEEISSGRKQVSQATDEDGTPHCVLESRSFLEF